MQAHAGQNLLDFVQGFATEVWRAEHVAFAFLNQVADINDVVVLEAIGGANRQFQLIDFAQQVAVEWQLSRFFFTARRLWFFNVDED